VRRRNSPDLIAYRTSPMFAVGIFEEAVAGVEHLCVVAVLPDLIACR
jgi:hypothetical protein